MTAVANDADLRCDGCGAIVEALGDDDTCLNCERVSLECDLISAEASLAIVEASISAALDGGHVSPSDLLAAVEARIGEHARNYEPVPSLALVCQRRDRNYVARSDVAEMT
jgi:hypothetical protein